MAESFWTDERTAALKKLWGDGYSAAQIAGDLGSTRGAVLGKVFRLKLEPPATKQVYNITRVYTRQPVEVAKAKARIREARYSAKRKARERAKNLAIFRANRASPTSAAYRKHLPPLPDMSKGELRAMLARAFQNTAAMQ